MSPAAESLRKKNNTTRQPPEPGNQKENGRFRGPVLKPPRGKKKPCGELAEVLGGILSSLNFHSTVHVHRGHWARRAIHAGVAGTGRCFDRVWKAVIFYALFSFCWTVGERATRANAGPLSGFGACHGGVPAPGYRLVVCVAARHRQTAHTLESCLSGTSIHYRPKSTGGAQPTLEVLISLPRSLPGSSKLH